MAALLAGLVFAGDTAEAELAIERARAHLLLEAPEPALEQAKIALTLDASSWQAHLLYLDACAAAGLLARCEGEMEGLALEDPLAFTVLSWHRVRRGAAEPVVLSTVEEHDEKLVVLALADQALAEGSHPVVDVMLGDVDSPEAVAIRMGSWLDRGLHRAATAGARRAWEDHPNRPDVLTEFFASRDKALRGTQRSLTRAAERTAADTLDPAWLWRWRRCALATGDESLVAKADANLRRVGETPGLARLPWGEGMRSQYARAMVMSRDAELPDATASELEDVALRVAAGLQDMGRIPEALAIFEAARERADSPALALAHAQQLLRTRSFAEAVTVAEAALKLALRPLPDDVGRIDAGDWSAQVAEAYATLATAEVGNGRAERALELATTASLLSPRGPYLALRASLQQAEGYTDAAFVSWAIANALGGRAMGNMDETWRGAGEMTDGAMAVVDAWSASQGSGTPASRARDVDSAEDGRSSARGTRPRVGRPFPEWKVGTDEEGLSSEATAGQVVVLSFWASWCGPCREELPALERILARLASKGVEVTAVGISTDESERDYARFRDEQDFEHVQLVHEPQLGERLRVKALPTMWIIGRDGRAWVRHVGYDPSHEASLEAELREIAEGE